LLVFLDWNEKWPTQVIHPRCVRRVRLCHFDYADVFGDQEEELPKALELTFDSASSLINLKVFEHTDLVPEPVPLSLDFEYHPEAGYAPIQEVVQGRNRAIKAAYWQLWGLGGGPDGMSALKTTDVFEGDEVEVREDEIEQFCKVGILFATLFSKNDDMTRPKL
jgi:fatty acid synthase subunit beta